MDCPKQPIFKIEIVEEHQTMETSLWKKFNDWSSKQTSG